MIERRNSRTSLVFMKKILCITFFLLISLGAIQTVSAAYDTDITWTHLSSKTGDIPPPGSSIQQTASLILDIDKDGINDFIIGSRKGGSSLFWYKKSPSGWTRYLIESDTLSVEAGGAFNDIDGDGDLDVVFGGDWQSNKVWWWENPYPQYDPDKSWVRREIKNSGANQHHDEIFGDFDGDGKNELVFWNQKANKLFLADIPADPKSTQPWPYTEIWSSDISAEGIGKSDIDKDGKVDLIAGGRWFKHTGGTDYTAYVIDDSQRTSRIAAGDLIVGGNPEIVMVPGDASGRLKWYECTGDPADPKCWVGHDLLGFDVDHGHSLDVVDINNDGKLDIFAAEMNLNGGNPKAKNWVFFGNGDGNFETKLISEGIGNHESKVADLDGDLDVDILGKPYNWDTPRIDIWLNSPINHSLEPWDRQLIDAQKPWRALFITSADMDNDGHKDIITGGWWYKNPGIQGGNWIRNTIGQPLNNMATVYDFDNDGDMDVLGTQGKGSDPNAIFVWGRNDGSGKFTILNNIEPGDGDFLQGVAVGRFQGNSKLEIVLSWHEDGKGIQMLTLPPDPSNDIWSLSRISTTSQDEALSAGDIDRDGDIDLLLGTKWLNNNGGSWEPYTLNPSSGSPDRNKLADINGDGRLDAIVGFEAASIPGKLAWYEQGDKATSIWQENIVANVIGPMSLDVTDIDNDGDQDIIAGEHSIINPSGAKLLIFENSDGNGKIWNKYVIYTGDEHHDGAQTVDIDNDGDLDVISIGWTHEKVILYENKAIKNTQIKTPGKPVLSDDFNSQTLNTSLWTIIDPKSDSRFGISGYGTPDALLSITVPAGTSHDVWNGNFAPRIMQSVNNTDFEIEIKFQSQLNSQYQTQGLIVEQDSQNYLRFDIFKDEINTRIFAASFTGGSPTVRYNAVISPVNPLYLRVKRAGNEWMQSYSYDGTIWTNAASFDHTLTVTSAGPFVGNQGNQENSSPAFTGLIDYFFNTLSPIAPEDSNTYVEPPVITIQPVNQNVKEGRNATFSVVATGASPLSYQWQKNGIDIPGATDAMFTTSATTISDNGSNYRVNVINPAGSVLSDPATLTVYFRPNIITNPGFEEGTTSWNFYTRGIGSFGVIQPGLEGNNSAQLALASEDSNIQLYQKGITLEPNTSYQLSFAAFSTRGNNVTVRLIQHVSPYNNYGLDFTPNLSKSWQTFTTEFNTTGFTDIVNDGRLMFWFTPFATSGDTYYIDEIKLEKING
ncbi:Endoglucanase C [Methanosarcinales archaeon]|nr:Endoglucanase C [Methanosarcinales archaeon]